MKSRVKFLRGRKGLTLRDLEQKVKVDFSTLGKIENGKRDLTLEQAILLADYFNVTLDYLVYRLDHDISLLDLKKLLDKIDNNK